MPSKTTIVVLSGISGTYKMRIAGMLVAKLENTDIVPTVTTRLNDHHKIPGAYVSVSQDEFTAERMDGRLLWEHAYGSTRFGTRKSALEAACESKGAVRVMSLAPEKVSELRTFVHSRYDTVRIRPIFLLPPPIDTLRRRLDLRELRESEQKLREQLEENWETMARACNSGFAFVNGNKTIDSLREVVLDIAEVLAEYKDAA